MAKKNPAPRAVGNGAEMVKQLGKLYGHSTAPAPTIKPGSIVTFTLVPGARLEVVEVIGRYALLDMPNGTVARVEVSSLVVVS